MSDGHSPVDDGVSPTLEDKLLQNLLKLVIYVLWTSSNMLNHQKLEAAN